RVPDTVIKQSPMFSSHSFVMGGTNVGTTQYIDAFQRANFWDAVVANGGTYHTKLGLQVLPAFLFNVPVSRGTTFPSDEFVGGCTAGNFGIVDINWFAPLIINRVLPRLIAEGKVSPKTFPIFMIYSVGMSIGPPTNLKKCCVGGFHSAVLTGSGAIQTF